MKNIMNRIALSALAIMLVFALSAEAQKKVTPSSKSKTSEKNAPTQAPTNEKVEEVKSKDFEEAKVEQKEYEVEEEEYKDSDESEEYEGKKIKSKKDKANKGKGNRGKGNVERGENGNDKDLGLSEQQREQLKDIREDQREEFKILRKEHQQAQKDLRFAYKANASEAEIRAKTQKIEAIEAKMEMINREHQENLRRILTPEQYEKMMASREIGQMRSMENKRAHKNSQK